MIKTGDPIPAVAITAVIDGEQNSTTTDMLFADRKVVLFAVPGAFTPTCSNAHLPGYVTLADDIRTKGVDMIACLSVNDAFVMKAWGEVQNAGQITLLADGGAAFTRALGLEMETGDFGGVRSKRYAMIIEDNRVTLLNVEPPKTFESSSAEAILQAL